MIDWAWLEELIVLTQKWIYSQRQRYYPLGRELSTSERQLLSGYFEKTVLDRVRLHTGSPIEEPAWFPQKVEELQAEGYKVGFDFKSLEGITFIHAIVLSGADPPKDDQGRRSLLFHELVHVVQYELLGLENFARHYIGGLQEANFTYLGIPLECMAYAVQHEFDGGSQFQVRERVQSQLRGKGYLT